MLCDCLLDPGEDFTGAFHPSCGGYSGLAPSIDSSFFLECAPSRTAGWGALGHIPSLPCSPGCDLELDSRSRSRLAAAQRAPVQRAPHSEGPGMVGLAAGLFQVLYWPLGGRVGWCEPSSSMGSQLTLPASLVLKVGDLSVVACAPCLEQEHTQLPVAR